MAIPISAYTSHLIARPGDVVTFHAHATEPGPADVDLVRIGTDRGPADHDAVNVPSSFEGTINVQTQKLAMGNYGLALFAAPCAISSFTLACAVQPMRPSRKQAVFGVGDRSNGLAHFLGLDEAGKPCVVDGAGAPLLTCPRPLRRARWTLLAAIYDAQHGTLELVARHLPQGPAEKERIDRVVAAVTLPNLSAADAAAFAARSTAFAANHTFADHFDGKIEAPRLFSQAMSAQDAFAAVMNPNPGAALNADHHEAVVGWWDFSHGIGSDHVPDLGPNKLHGKLQNLPSRAVKGLHWDGRTQRWTDIPWHYGAAKFNSDAQYDCGWDPLFEWQVPADLPSGAYAARFRQGSATAYATVFVEPPATRPRKSVVFLAPTASYLAYANEIVHIGLLRILEGREPTLSPAYTTLLANPQFGRSVYEHHADGTGIRHSSWLRPLINVALGARQWAFPADVAILRFLSRELGEDGFDVLTDHGIHEHGFEALKGARVVVTGSHPEYYTPQMLEAVEHFLREGGRLMYMGGNGFYWKIGIPRRGTIELRRAEDGTRAWIEEPGEYYHESDGELGGMWRRNGKAPNRLCGIGFAAQGFRRSTYYARKPGSLDPRATWIFRGVGPKERIGDFGAIGGGAAGEEIDRYDRSLGSPAHALILASSENHADDMLRVKEELFSTRPLGKDPQVRADMVFFETAHGGAVWSTGSIAWAGSLEWNGGRNNVQKVTANVLRRFADSSPFAFPDEESDPEPIRPRM